MYTSRPWTPTPLRIEGLESVRGTSQGECCQCDNVANSQSQFPMERACILKMGWMKWQLATLELATFSHWQHLSTNGYKWGDTPLTLLFLPPISLFSVTFLILDCFGAYYSESAALKSSARRCAWAARTCASASLLPRSSARRYRHKLGYSTGWRLPLARASPLTFWPQAPDS